MNALTSKYKPPLSSTTGNANQDAYSGVEEIG